MRKLTQNSYKALLTAGVLLLSGCTQSEGSVGPGEKIIVVTTSSIVEDIVNNISGGEIVAESIIPNGFDSHTYEPKPSEIEKLEEADLIVLADETLNGGISQLVKLSGDESRILDLNKAALSTGDFIMRKNAGGWNPHTWTDPNLVMKWVGPIKTRLQELLPGSREIIEKSASEYLQKLEDLDFEIKEAFSNMPKEKQKLVVYHDAWEYFGKKYKIEIVGALQALDFSEPSAAELEKMAEQIKTEQVKAFFGSEVFPSDVLEALERESGAMYIPDLADDKLNGEPGGEGYGYIPLMRANLQLLIKGLSL
jgi:manganese/iron transport system substrate-binding protein